MIDLRTAPDGLDARRSSVAGAHVALFLLVVASPLFFLPVSASPFADPKLFILTIAACVGVGSIERVEMRLAVPAGVLAAAAVVATVTGVDPLWSLWGGENGSFGAIAIVACAALVVVGAGLPPASVDVVPRWLVITGGVVSGTSMVLLVLPDGVSVLRSQGVTLGQPVLLGGLAAAAIAAALCIERRWWVAPAVFVVASGLSISGNRSGMAGAAVGLAATAVVRRAGMRAVLRVAIPVVAALAVWTAVDTVAPAQLSPVTMLAELDDAAQSSVEGEQGAARARPIVWKIFLRAASSDPVFGTGPATGWGTFLGNATADEVGAVGRGWGDAHNLPVDTIASMGIVGALAMLWLALTVVRRRSRDPRTAWASGVVCALAVHHLFQPSSVVLTPLLFFAAGVAARSVDVGPPRPRRWAAAVLIPLVALAALRLGASTMESYGTTYASVPALELSRTLQPGRVSATEELALALAVDARARDAEARTAAALTARALVARHGWNPGVRLAAADVWLLLDRPEEARSLVDEHLRLFPHDPVALAGAAVIASRAGDEEAARDLARRALRIDPNLRQAREIAGTESA